MILIMYVFPRLFAESPLSHIVEAAIQARWSKIMGPEYEIVVSDIFLNLAMKFSHIFYTLKYAIIYHLQATFRDYTYYYSKCNIILNYYYDS